MQFHNFYKISRILPIDCTFPRNSISEPVFPRASSASGTGQLKAFFNLNDATAEVRPP